VHLVLRLQHHHHFPFLQALSSISSRFTQSYNQASPTRLPPLHRATALLHELHFAFRILHFTSRYGIKPPRKRKRAGAVDCLSMTPGSPSANTGFDARLVPARPGRRNSTMYRHMFSPHRQKDSDCAGLYAGLLAGLSPSWAVYDSEKACRHRKEGTCMCAQSVMKVADFQIPNHDFPSWEGTTENLRLHLPAMPEYLGR